MWSARSTSAIAVVVLALVAVLVSADTQYTMSITITDPTFRSTAFQTALGTYSEHRDSCPLRFIALPAQGTTQARTVQVVFSIDSGASAACASSLRDVMGSQGNNGVGFANFRAALSTNGVGTLLSITVANPAPPSGGGDDNDQNKLWVFIGAGVVAGVVVIIGVAVLVLRGKERRAALDQDAAQGDHLQPLAGPTTNDDSAHQQQQQQQPLAEQPAADTNGNGEQPGTARKLAQQPAPAAEPQPEPKPEVKPEASAAPEPAPAVPAAEDEPAPPVKEAEEATPAAQDAPQEADDVAVEEDEEKQTAAASPQEGDEAAAPAAAEATTPAEEPVAAAAEATEEETAEEAPAPEEEKEEVAETPVNAP